MLGVDVGASTAVAVVDALRPTHLVTSCVVRLPATDSPRTRYTELGNALRSTRHGVERQGYDVRVCAVEQQWVGRNGHTARRLLKAQGFIEHALVRHWPDAHHIEAPISAIRARLGVPNKKDAAAEKVAQMFGAYVAGFSGHEHDALAVCIWGAAWLHENDTPAEPVQTRMEV